MSFTKHFEQIRQEAIKTFLNDGVLLPRLYYLKNRKIIAVTPLLFEEHNKQAAYREILQKAKTLRADGFIEASESWYVKYEDDEPIIAPSKHAKRRECVMLFGRGREKSGIETQVHIYEIVRVGKQVDLIRRHELEPENPEKTVAWFDSYFSST